MGQARRDGKTLFPAVLASPGETAARGVARGGRAMPQGGPYADRSKEQLRRLQSQRYLSSFRVGEPSKGSRSQI